MQRAVGDFLRAAGLDLDDANLQETPERVTAAWADEFLTGYSQTASDALADRFPVSRKADRELVVVTNLHFRSMCPHHLMPYSGVAHLAYVPSREVVGFGRLSALIDVFAHRLVLQEELARLVAHSLMTELGSAGAACLIRAEQTCFRLRGEEQHGAVTFSEAYEGVLKEPSLRGELWARLGASETKQG
ncbi:MAG: GTP cyclohydrolase I FolE [Archangium gephyra]|uniref:GTP cyclohydrolase I n=1 Tax=Archangium gephyra TaxID=48 RepID=A0A2W5UXC8_9BACT|nr:MAG: GTP cyclohydrolase I FolE [Archangium gephyra]